MSDIAVRVEGLGKRYNLAARRQPQPMLREILTGALVTPFTRLAGLGRRLMSGGADDESAGGSSPTHFWALRGVSFEVEQGQIVGIIGRNGAGKSTLLRLLSRITEPTEGRIEIHGRVASLLEVGTGFHPELTGRENVYLSGALLGMRKGEIDRKLDEILAFAELDRFADTAVKRFSSGMYVRLAFSVAAHLEPDILVVDEVLAVGDAAFQRKCLAKMEDVSQEGRTVLFVAHNIPAVTRLCERALLMANGAIQKDGPAAQIASEYVLSSLKVTGERSWPDQATAPGDHVARLRGVRICSEKGATTDAIDIRHPVGLEMDYEILRPGAVVLPCYDVFTEAGMCLFATRDSTPESHGPRGPGRFISTAWIPGNLLTEGVLLVGATLFSLTEHRMHAHEREAVAFHAVDGLDGEPTGRSAFDRAIPGVVRPVLRWTTTGR